MAPKRGRGQGSGRGRGSPEPIVPNVTAPASSSSPAAPKIPLTTATSHNTCCSARDIPFSSALLPSVGCGDVTVEDDAEYIRNKMVLPILDVENRDVILFMHSYSSVPGSAAARGLGRAERERKGKKTAVIGQVFLAGILQKGGDGKNILESFGGKFPPHIRADTEADLLRCDDRIPPLYQDVIPAQLAAAVSVSATAQGMTSFTSPVPRASWDHVDFKDRLAYIRTVNDAAIPVEVQQAMIDGSGVDWYESDIESGHSPQISHAREMCELLIDLAVVFESV